MQPTKTPTSLLSAIRLLITFVWHRIPLFTRWTYSGGPSLEIPTTHSSPAARLPFELVEIIISYLAYDICSLRACTLTCHSWCIAAVPLLHHTLICPTYVWREGKHMWLLPLIRKKNLGLLPLIEALWVYGSDTYRVPFSPGSLFPRGPLPLFPLTNVTQLRIDYLDIHSFLPRIRLCSGQLLPALRELALEKPKGSCRELTFFIGLFQHLQDLKLFFVWSAYPEAPVGDLKLIPPFIPPLQGLLMVRGSMGVGLFRDMIDLFEGLRFRHMDLLGVGGMRFLLDACAKTLESLVLDPSDPRAELSLLDFGLSWNKSLKTLKVPALSIDGKFADVSSTITFLKKILSTITSSAFSEVVVVYEDRDFPSVGYWSSCQPTSPHEMPRITRPEAARFRWEFEQLLEVHTVREFQLVLCVSVCGCVGEYPVRMLEEAVARAKGGGVFSKGFSDPLVVCNPRRTHERY